MHFIYLGFTKPPIFFFVFLPAFPSLSFPSFPAHIGRKKLSHLLKRYLVPCLQMDHIKPRALGLGHTSILFPHPPAMTAGIRAPSLKSEDMKKRNIGWFYPQRPQGASLSTFLGWLNHWVITQRHPHKCATIRLDLSRISQHFLHLWNFHFQMSQALIQVFFHLETSLIVKLAQKITWSEHFPPRCVFSNLSNFDWRVFMHCY